jgi:uncharacterized protein (DUF305 family)
MNRNRHVLAFVMTLLALLAVVGCGSDNGEQSEGNGTAQSAPFDRAFIDAMVPHHEAAIEMARAALSAGLSQTDLTAVAQDIIDAQQREIEDMRSWREEWFGSREIDPEGAAQLGLTDAEMGMAHGSAEIEGADDVDRAFAAAMISHHDGAILMAKLARDRAEHEQIRVLAEQIIDAQEAEIEILTPHAEGGHHGS